MKKKFKYIIIICSVAVIGFIVYSFLFGKLFPYSPVILGFSENELEHTVFYVQDGAEFNGFIRIDSLIPKVEKFHEMKFLKKPRIFIFKDADSFYRRSMTKARFCALYNGDIIISPWAIEEDMRGEISLEIYLTHELSHSILHQNSGFIRAFRYPAWLLEGIAMYSADQMGTSFYPSKEETYNYIRKGNFMPPEYFKTGKEDGIDLNVQYRITFMYSEFGCIVDHLIEKYGMKKFLEYMKELTKNSGHDMIFKRIYGIEFAEFIRDFSSTVNL